MQKEELVEALRGKVEELNSLLDTAASSGVLVKMRVRDSVKIGKGEWPCVLSFNAYQEIAPVPLVFDHAPPNA